MIRALQEQESFESGCSEGEGYVVFPIVSSSQKVAHLQGLSKHAGQLKKRSGGTRYGGEIGSVTLSYTGVSKTCTRGKHPRRVHGRVPNS